MFQLIEQGVQSTAFMVVTLIAAFIVVAVVMMKGSARVWASESSLDSSQKSQLQEIQTARRAWDLRMIMLLIIPLIAIFWLMFHYRLSLTSFGIFGMMCAAFVLDNIGNTRTLNSARKAPLTSEYTSALQSHHKRKRWVQVACVLIMIFYWWYVIPGVVAN